MHELKDKIVDALNEYMDQAEESEEKDKIVDLLSKYLDQAEPDESQETKPSKYGGLELLARLLFIAASCPGFTIQGNHLAGLADLLLKYLEVTEQIDRVREAERKEAVAQAHNKTKAPQKRPGLKPI